MKTTLEQHAHAIAWSARMSIWVLSEELEEQTGVYHRPAELARLVQGEIKRLVDAGEFADAKRPGYLDTDSAHREGQR